MSGMEKANKIRHIVRLRQMLRRWRKKAAAAAKISRSGSFTPADVPSGHLAVYVGECRRRYVVKAAYLNLQVFRHLLNEAEEEYGYDYKGPISIPCDEFIFEEILGMAAREGSSRTVRMNGGDDLQRCSDGWILSETRPLLAQRSIG